MKGAITTINQLLDYVGQSLWIVSHKHSLRFPPAVTFTGLYGVKENGYHYHWFEIERDGRKIRRSMVDCHILHNSYNDWYVLTRVRLEHGADTSS